MKPYSNKFLNFLKIFSLIEVLGWKLSAFSISSKAFFSSLFKVSGTYTLTFTSKSPVPYPFTLGRPLLRRRSTLPGWVPGSIFTFTLPSMVGISTVPPKAAVGKLSSKLYIRSFSSRISFCPVPLPPESASRPARRCVCLHCLCRSWRVACPLPRLWESLPSRSLRHRRCLRHRIPCTCL